MYHNCAKRFSLFILLIATSFLSFAQNSNKENSPYSRFGIGEFRNGLNPQLRGMGSISTAYASEFSINTDNPASYASLRLTTYDISGEGSVKKILAGNQHYSTGMATLSQLSIGVPVSKHAAFLIGLRPFTRTYYMMSDTTDLPGIGRALRTYSGDGSTNYIFLGLAGKFKNFSAGINAGYLFGTIRRSSVLSKLYDTISVFNADFSTYDRIGGLYWKAGVMYEGKVNKKMDFRAGATLALNQQLNSWLDVYELSWRYSGSSQIFDTAVSVQGQKNKTTLPLSYSIGIQLVDSEKKWSAGLDFFMQQWQQYRNHHGQPDSLTQQAWRLAAGAEYVPNNRNMYQYLNRITYRIGAYYGHDYVVIRNTSITYYALTAGLGLPFRRSMDRINLAMEIGRRGTQEKGLIQENFYKLSVGITLNDKWFVKRRYD